VEMAALFKVCAFFDQSQTIHCTVI